MILIPAVLGREEVVGIAEIEKITIGPPLHMLDQALRHRGPIGGHGVGWGLEQEGA